MAGFIERLLKLNKDGSPMSQEEERARFIPEHDFDAVMAEFTQGYLTENDIKTIWDLDNDEYTDFLLLTVKNPAAKDDKALFADHLKSTIKLFHSRRYNYTGYKSADDVRTKLGIPKQGA